MPSVPVVAFCVVVAPFGKVSVKVTFAPEAGTPPLVTDTVMVAVLGRVKVVPETERLAASDGALITVTLAVPEPW